MLFIFPRIDFNSLEWTLIGVKVKSLISHLIFWKRNPSKMISIKLFKSIQITNLSFIIIFLRCFNKFSYSLLWEFLFLFNLLDFFLEVNNTLKMIKSYNSLRDNYDTVELAREEKIIDIYRHRVKVWGTECKLSNLF